MAKIGHNTGANEKFLFFHHLQKRLAHNAKLDEINAKKKADAKTAQADGVSVGDIDFAIRTMAASDKQLVADQFNVHGEILNWLGVLSGFQGDLLRDRAPAIERIEKQGEMAGLAGRNCESGYTAKSEEDSAWVRGWNKGQKFMADNLKKDMERRNKESAGEQSDHGDNVDMPEEE